MLCFTFLLCWLVDLPDGHGGALRRSEHIPDTEPDAAVDQPGIARKDKVPRSDAGRPRLGQNHISLLEEVRYPAPEIVLFDRRPGVCGWQGGELGAWVSQMARVGIPSRYRCLVFSF